MSLLDERSTKALDRFRTATEDLPPEKRDELRGLVLEALQSTAKLVAKLTLEKARESWSDAMHVMMNTEPRIKKGGTK